MDVFVHFPPGTAVARDLVEDALEDALGEAGHVTGVGSGVEGSNVDLHVNDKVPRDKVLQLLREARTRVGIAKAKIVIQGTEHPFSS